MRLFFTKKKKPTTARYFIQIPVLFLNKFSSKAKFACFSRLKHFVPHILFHGLLLKKRKETQRFNTIYQFHTNFTLIFAILRFLRISVQFSFVRY